MGFQMHTYGNATGLAVFCDKCGDQITDGDGWIIWNGDNPSDWLVIHHARCDDINDRHRYDCSLPLEAEIIYLANSAGVDLDKARKAVRLFASLD